MTNSKEDYQLDLESEWGNPKVFFHVTLLVWVPRVERSFPRVNCLSQEHNTPFLNLGCLPMCLLVKLSNVLFIWFVIILIFFY